MATMTTGPVGSGLAHPKFVRYSAAGLWWNTSGTPGFEVFDAAHIAAYGIAGTEIGSTGKYTATDPANGVAGHWEFVAAAGVSLTQADVLNNLRWEEGVNPAPTAAEVADALLDLTDGVETGLTPRGCLRLVAATLAGKLSGAATDTVVIRNAVADSKARITAAVDANGNRTAVTVDVS